jgi:parvulin-like peptidyl-prolyl isomerase
MAQFIRWIGIAALVLASGCGKKEAQVVAPRTMTGTEMVVWVDQAGITSGQIQKEVGRLLANVPKDLPPAQMQAVQMRLLQQAVDNLVVRQLVKSEMDRSGVLITAKEIEKGKQDLEKGLGEGHSLALLIAQANLPMEELEDNLRLDLFKNKMIKDKLEAALAEVTDEAVKTYYDEHPEEFTIPAGRLASHVLIRIPPAADEKAKTDLRAKAEGVRKALLEGADFAKLAAEVSECPSRARGGVLGVIPRGRESPAFEDAVYGQKIGEIGEVVESPAGFHVIQVTGEQEEKVLVFDEVKDRLKAVLRTKAQQKVTAAYIEELKNKATIKLDDALMAATAGKKAPAAKEAGEASEVAPAAETPVPVP